MIHRLPNSSSKIPAAKVRGMGGVSNFTVVDSEMAVPPASF